MQQQVEKQQKHKLPSQNSLQQLQFTLSPNGELKFNGESSPENIEVVQQLVNSSDYRKQLADRLENSVAFDQKVFAIAHYGFLGSLSLCCLILAIRAVAVHHQSEQNNAREYVRGRCSYSENQNWARRRYSPSQRMGKGED